MAKKSLIIRFPDGTCARAYVINGVAFDGDSVIVQGSGFVITTIDVDNYEDRQRVMDLIYECMEKGKSATQPDWSFLTDKTKPVKK